jgi:Uri superfamily endonuclease
VPSKLSHKLKQRLINGFGCADLPTDSSLVQRPAFFQHFSRFFACLAKLE